MDRESREGQGKIPERFGRGSELNRRDLLKLGGLGAGALMLPGVLAACGGGSSSSSGTTGGSVTTAESPELKKLLDGIESKQVIIANYGGVTEEVRKRVFWEPFTARTGVQVIEADAGALAVPMLLGEIPTKWDAVHGSTAEGYAAQLYGKKPLPKTPKAAWEDLVKPRKMQPYIFQSFSVGYAPAMIKGTFSGPQPETWADFFDTKKFPGKRAWPAEYFYTGSLEAALLADGVAPEDIYPMDFERAAAKVKSIFDDLVIYTEYPQAQTFLTTKTASMAFAPNGLWHELEEKGIEIQLAWEAPVVLDTNGFNILPEAPNLDAVQALAAFCNQPHLQAEFAQQTGYGLETKAAFKELSKPEQEALPNGPQRTYAFTLEPIYFAEHQREIEKTEKTIFS
mgnify:CR=1 FL=1